VADNALALAGRFGAKPDLVRAGALLHDIADAVMNRNADKLAHANKTLEIARDLMDAAGFALTDIKVVLDDALPRHSCHGNTRPATAEGKVLATADAMAHLQTDFYVHGVWGFGVEDISLEEAKRWALEKIERDYRIKIQFDEIRKLCEPDYRALKAVFGR
jgi:putative nucleotidyltransferase with HDIG domain